MHAKTPGHPEVGVTPGVETTTGPLGQGFANAVGMAIAEKTLAAQFNRPGHTIVDHRTFVFLGDGCLMEGISHEAASLAGRLKLGKLVALYDDNGISIDGKVEEWFADDTPARFEAYGWHVVRHVDGHDPAAINDAILDALESGKPSLICCKTVIGRGAPTKQGTENSHGAPLGPEEAAKAKAAFGWSHPPFVVPDEVYAQWDQRARGAKLHADWTARFAAYQAAYPELAAEFERRIKGDLPANFDRRHRARPHRDQGRRHHRQPQGRPGGALGLRARLPRAAWAARPTSPTPTSPISRARCRSPATPPATPSCSACASSA